MKKTVIFAVIFTIIFSFGGVYAASSRFGPDMAAVDTAAGIGKIARTAYAALDSGANASAADAVANSGTNAREATDLDLNNITIARLVEIALASSRQALADDVNIKKKEMAVRTVRSDIDAMSDSIKSVTKPMEVRLDLDVAKKAKQDNLNQLKVDVYKTAMNILLCGKEIELKEYKLTVAQEKLKIAEARFKAAAVTQDVLDSARYAVDSAKVELENSREKRNSYFLELRRLLNLPLSTDEIFITDELKQAAFVDIDINSVLSGLYETETSVFKAAGKLEIAQTAMDIAGKLYTKGNLYYDNAVIDLEEARLDLAAAKSALDAQVKNKYNDLLNRHDDIELAAKYAELVRKKLDVARIKYDKGTITREAYLDADVALKEAEYEKLAAIAEFNGVNAEFCNMIGRQ